MGPGYSFILGTAVTQIIDRAKSIPLDWSIVEDAEKSLPKNLFQKVMIWNDQVNRLRNAKSEQRGGYLFETPACFLEIIPDESEQMLANVTNTNYIWRLHMVDTQLDAGDDENLDQNLFVFAYRDLVRQNMVGFQPTNSSALFACDEKQDYEHDDIYHYTMDFKSCLTDTSGSYLNDFQTEYNIKPPKTNAELVTGFQNPITDAPLTDPLTLEITP